MATSDETASMTAAAVAPTGEAPTGEAAAGAPLRSDVDAGLRFVHLMGMQAKSDQMETSSMVLALVESLVAQGVLDYRGFQERVATAKQRQTERFKTQAFVKVADNADKYALKDTPKIDCDARIPLCQGRCCRLTFPLSFQDLDEKVVEWDYSEPYQIRKRDDGYCVHNAPTTRTCGVYQHRPGICRTYDCRKDARIWIDFEKRIPAEDLIPAAALKR